MQISKYIANAATASTMLQFGQPPASDL